MRQVKTNNNYKFNKTNFWQFHVKAVFRLRTTELFSPENNVII